MQSIIAIYSHYPHKGMYLLGWMFFYISEPLWYKEKTNQGNIFDEFGLNTKLWKLFLSEHSENLCCLVSINFFSLSLLFSLCVLKMLFWLHRKLLISSVCFHFSYVWSVIFRLCCFLLVALAFAGDRGKKLPPFITYFSSIISALLTFVQLLPQLLCATFSQNVLEISFKRNFSKSFLLRTRITAL